MGTQPWWDLFDVAAACRAELPKQPCTDGHGEEQGGTDDTAVTVLAALQWSSCVVASTRANQDRFHFIWPKPLLSQQRARCASEKGDQR